MTRSLVFSLPMPRRALWFFAASVLLVACSSSSSNQPANDGGLLPDGGTTPDGGATPDGGTPDGAPIIERFGADPLGLPTDGGVVTLFWDVMGADRLSIDQAVGEVSGNDTMVTVTETTRFTLTATNDKGSVTSATSVFTSTGAPAPFPRSGVPTSMDAIEAALETGSIDDVTALRYKVFALFGDPRLPAEFEAEGLVHGTPIMKELAVRFADLDPQVQAELQPFTLPPDDPESWYQRTPSTRGVSPKGGASAWDSVEVAGGKVVVWWESAIAPTEQNLVEQVLAPAIEGAYNRLVDDLKMRPPISDDPQPGSPYRVYIVDAGGGDYGWTRWELNDSVGVYPTHVVVDLGVTGSAAGDMAKATAAHELMHACQAAYERVDDIFAPASEWLEESTATWAEDYVYPHFNTEHEYVEEFVTNPEMSLDDISGDREYGAYLFFIFVDRQFGDEKIREIWEDLELTDVFDAVDFNLDGELANLWSKFAAYNWNKDAPTVGSVTYHGLWDELSDGPNGVFWSTAQEGLQVTAQQEIVEMDELSFGVEHLSAHYYYYDLTDPSLHNIVLANGFTFDLQEGSPELFPTDVTLYATKLPPEDRKGASVQVLVKANGKWFPNEFDITDVAFVPFCQDFMEERVEELVVIFSNGRWDADDRDPIEPQGLTPRLFVNNVSCGDWVGEGTAFTAYADGPDSEITTVTYENLLFTRDRIPHEALLQGDGQFDFLGTIAPFDATALSVTRYRPEIVDVQWETDIRTTSGDDECIALGSGSMTAANAQLAFFDIHPSFVGPTADPASAYRSFFMQLSFRAPGLPVIENCSESGTEMLPFQTFFEGGLRNTELGLFEISPDGDSINETWEIRDTTFRLDLLGFPDP